MSFPIRNNRFLNRKWFSLLCLRLFSALLLFYEKFYRRIPSGNLESEQRHITIIIHYDGTFFAFIFFYRWNPWHYVFIMKFLRPIIIALGKKFDTPNNPPPPTTTQPRASFQSVASHVHVEPKPLRWDRSCGVSLILIKVITGEFL